MKNKDNVLKLVLSVLLVVFGLLLLLDQMDVKFVDDFFTPWYTIIILFVASCLLSYAIVKKAPIFYIFAMFFAGLFLVVSLDTKIKDLNVGRIIAIIPLFIGIGIVIADKICKWSPKAMRLGIVMTVASSIVLISTILDVWKYVIPAVIIMIGIAYILFGLIALKHENKKVEDDHYVTYEPKDKDKPKENESENDK